VEGQHIRLSAPDKLPPEVLDGALLADINARESQGKR
jgi:Cd2+/Zn2+-exporting ATPase